MLHQSIQGNKLLNFSSRTGRLTLMVFFLVSMLPTLIYHVDLKMKLEDVSLRTLNQGAAAAVKNPSQVVEGNPTNDDSEEVDDFSSTSDRDDAELRNLKSLDDLIQANDDDDEVGSDDLQGEWKSKQEVVVRSQAEVDDSERRSTVNLSTFYIIFSFIVLIMALILDIMNNKLVAKRALGVIVQGALTGFMPLSIMKAPFYPLLTLNMLMYGAMTTLNVLYLVKGFTQQFIVFLITMIWTTMVFVWRQRRFEAHPFFTELGLDEPALILTPSSLSYGYAAHFQLISFIAFWSVALAGSNMKLIRKEMNKMAKTQIDRLNEIMGHEDRPYVVAKVIEQGRHRVKLLSKRSVTKLEQFGFNLTYISTEFDRIFLNSMNLQVEDLIFREIASTENSRINVDSSDEDESVRQTNQAGAESVDADSGIGNFATDKEKQRTHDKKINRWLGKDAKLFNLKQIIDGWNPNAPITHSYELKTVQQLKRDKLDSFHQQKNFTEPIASPDKKDDFANRDAQLLTNPFDVNNLDHDEEAKDRVNRLQARKQRLREEKIKREVERELQNIQVYVRVKIRQVVRGTSLFRIAQITKIQNPKKEIPEEESEEENDFVVLSQTSNRDQDEEGSELLLSAKKKTADLKQSSKSTGAPLKKRGYQSPHEKMQSKMYKIVLQLMPDQLTHLSTISNCAEGIIFNIQKILENRHSSKGLSEISKKLRFSKGDSLQNQQSIEQIKEKSQTDQLYPLLKDSTKEKRSMQLKPSQKFSNSKDTRNRKSQLIQQRSAGLLVPLQANNNNNNDRTSPSVKSKWQKKKKSINMIPQSNHSFSEEIEMYSASVITSAKIISQILDTSIMCKNIAFKKLDEIPREILLAGPKSIVTEVNETINQLLVEKNIKVKVSVKNQRADQVAYPWPLYKSLLFHLLVWSVNNSQINFQIHIEIDYVQADECFTSGPAMMSKEEDMVRSNPPEGQLEFLSTTITFLGNIEYFKDTTFRKTVRLDPNYLVSKFNIGLIGGKLFNFNKEGVVMSLFLLPLNQDVLEAFTGPNSPDREFWKQKNLNIFTTIKEEKKRKLKSMPIDVFTRSIGQPSTLYDQTQDSRQDSFHLPSQSSYRSNMGVSISLSDLDDKEDEDRQHSKEQMRGGVNHTIVEEESNISSQRSSNFSSQRISTEKSNEDLSASPVSSKQRASPGVFPRPLAGKKKSSPIKNKSQPDWQHDIRMALLDDEDDEKEENKKGEEGKKNKQSGQFKKRASVTVPGMPGVGSAEGTNKNVFQLRRLKTIKEESGSDVDNKESLIVMKAQRFSQSNSSSKRSGNSPAVVQERLESVSSYTISADMDEEGFGGEIHHNMNDKYYMPIKGVGDSISDDGLDQKEQAMIIEEDSSVLKKKLQKKNNSSIHSFKSEKLSNSFQGPSLDSEGESQRQPNIISDRYHIKSNKGIRRQKDPRLLYEEESNLLGEHEMDKKHEELKVYMGQGIGSKKFNASPLHLSSQGQQKKELSQANSNPLKASDSIQSLSMKKASIKASSHRSQREQKMMAAQVPNPSAIAEQNAIVAGAPASVEQREIILELPEEEKKEDDIGEREEILEGGQKNQLLEGSSNVKEVEADEEEKELEDLVRNQPLQAAQDRSMSFSSGTEGENSSMSASSSEQCACEDTILLIDDICYNLIPIKMQIRSLLKVKVETCSNGKQGLERYVDDITKKCCRNYIHLILMDLNMPMMDGYESASKIHEVYEDLSQQPGYQDIIPKPVIFAISAHINDQAKQEAAEHKMVEFLSKPIKKEEFKLAIGRQLTPALFSRIENN